MKRTLSTREVADELLEDDNASWTYEGAYALAEYLEQYEEGLDTEIELDIVAMRCEYSEYESAVECIEECGYDCDFSDCDQNDIDEMEEFAMEHLLYHTSVIVFDSGIIIADF